MEKFYRKKRIRIRFFFNTFFFSKKFRKKFKQLRSGWNFPERCVSTRAFEWYLYRGASSNRLKVMTVLLVDPPQKTKRIEITFFSKPTRSKLDITFKLFELAGWFRYVRVRLVETHLSGKFQPDRSSLNFFRILFRKKTYWKKTYSNTFFFSVD